MFTIPENRVYRLGQTKPVHIVRFVVEHTLEETIADINRSRLALRDGSAASITTATTTSTDACGTATASIAGMLGSRVIVWGSRKLPEVGEGVGVLWAK